MYKTVRDTNEAGRDSTTRSRLDRLLAPAAEREPVRTAIVHPCGAAPLGCTINALRTKLVLPVLIGPPTRIAAAALEANEDLSDIPIVAVEHSHAAADAACRMARACNVDVVMKSNLHADELVAAHFIAALETVVDHT
jgi:hypothetical protein